jgi:hypothetical protein
MKLRRELCFCLAVLVLGVCPMLAASITYTINGTLGPVLSGSDPLGANGQSGMLTIVASTSLNPTSTGVTSATYTLPAGAITVVVGGTTYKTTGSSTLKYNVPLLGANTMVVTATVTVQGTRGTVVGTASLAKGSFILKQVQRHPAKFVPSPQTLTASTRAGGGGSQVKYTVPILGSTVLGLSGTASN